MRQPHPASDRYGVRSDRATEATLEVIYVDADAGSRERTRAALRDQLGEGSVRTAGSVPDGSELAAEGDPSCLVVDPADLDGSVHELLDAADCPAVLYTELDPSALPDPVVAAAESLVEKGKEASRAAFLAEKLRSVAVSGPDRSEYALRSALDHVEQAARDDETTVLVDDEGDVVWRDTAIASVVFGEGTDRGPVSNLFEWLADVTEDRDERVARLRDDPGAVGTVRVTTGDTTRHVLLRGNRLPEAAGSLRLVVLSDVTGRARAEARHAMLGLLVEHSQDGLYTLDERGVVDFCNESFAQSLGYEPDAVLGTHASELLAPGELAKGQATIQTLLDEDGPEETTVELTFECRDGTRREMSIHYTLIRGRDGAYRGLMGVLRDVTRRKERERALERSQRRFEAVFDSPMSMVQVLEPDGTLTRLNEPTESFLDAPEEQLKGVPLWETEWFNAQSETVQRDLRAAFRRAAEGEYLQWEESLRNGRGDERTIRGWIRPVTDESGSVVAVVSEARDVSAERARERELEASERRFDAVIDSPDAKVIVLNPDGTVDRANEAVATFLGTDPDSLEGTELWETDWYGAQSDDLKPKLHEYLERASDGEYVEYEEPMRDADGDERIVHTHVRPVRDDSGTVVAVVSESHDVTDQRQREQELQRVKERLELAVDGAEAGIWDWNADRDEFVYSGKWREILGLDAEALPASRDEWRGRIHPDDRPALRAELERVLDGGGTYQLTLRMLTATDEWRWVRASGRVVDRPDEPTRVVGVVLDLSEQKARERALETAKQRLELAVEGGELGIWDWDVETDEVVYAGQWSEMLGLDESELGATYEEASDRVHPDDHERARAELERLIEGETDLYQMALRLRTADDEWKWVRATGRAVERDDSGRASRVVGVQVDIDDEKAREQELRRVNDRLELAIEGAGLGIWDRDIRTDEVTYAGRWGEMLGYDTDELPHSFETWAENVHPEDLPRARAELERLEAGEIELYQVDFRMRTADDDWKWIRSNGKVVEYEDGEPARMVGIHIDVDDEKARERELRRANERLELAVEGPGLGIWDWEVRTDKVTYDGKWAEMLGYDPEELAQTYETFASRAHPDDLDRAERELDRLLAGEIELYQVDIRMRTADDDWKWVRAIGKVVEYDGDEPVRVVGIHVDIDEEKARERELQSAKERLELAVEGAELGVWDWNVQTGAVTFDGHWADMLGYSLEDLDPDQETWEELIHPDDEERAWAALEAHFDGETEYYHCDHRLRTADGDWKWIRDIGKVFEWDDEGEPVRAVGIHEDIDDQKRRQQEIERQRDELETLDRIHVLIQDIIRTLGEAASRADLERTLCERLVESDLYRFAWVGERGPGDCIVPRTSAGDDDGYLDGLEVTVDETETGMGPVGTAFRTGEVKVTQEIATCDRFEPWREAALSAGFESVVAIPLVNDEVVHGVLCVYADRQEAFGDRARETFATLGETAGFALAAIQNRQLLQRDTVVEMEFESTDREAILYDMACERDCRIESLGIVDTGAGDLEYFRVDGAPPAAICERLCEASNVAGARVVRTDGQRGGTVELKVGQTSRSTLLEVGARQTEMVADPEAQRITIEAPTDADPRTIRESLVQFAPGVELTAKRKRSRSPAVNAPETDLREDLTDRQREILQTAYLAGYYAWPRDTTAEELAETLDIASPTLHQHLRRGTRNVLATLFD